jgi:uncharacterized phage-associated protein
MTLRPSYTTRVADYEPTAFNRAILYVLDHVSSVPMTRLHKLLFLADLEYFLEHGQTMTEAPWVREKYGPMNRAMLPALKAMSEHEVDQEEHGTRQGRTVHVIRKGRDPRFGAALDEARAQVLDRVLSMTARLSDDEVKALAYSTTPMRVLEGWERHEGRKLLNTPIDFKRLSDPTEIEVPDEVPDLEARARERMEILEAMRPFIERALTGAGS